MIIWLMIFFTIKHFICDFPLQWAYQYKNKGKYGHPGGILHAIIHGLGTWIIILAFGLPVWVPFADAIIHYHVDWAKTNLTNHFKLRPDTSAWFWYLLGLDQMLHYLTYIGIIVYATKML